MRGFLSLRATVVIPTFDHGPTLDYSVRSALAQTVEEIEVFVIGDGVPESTREIVAELEREDDRVRFFDHPKGPRHGEAYRDAALQEARGEVVCYLADDDLWLPGHVESLLGLLRGADFAHALPLRIEPDGTLAGWAVDLAIPWFRQRMLGGSNWIPLSCGGHTLDAYRRLPAGWSTAPQGTPTDLFMWQKLLSLADGVYASGSQPTVLHFPSPHRQGWNAEARLAELARWAERVATPEGRGELLDATLAYLVSDRARLEAAASSLQADLESVRKTATWRLRERVLGSRLGPVARAIASRSRRRPRG